MGLLDDAIREHLELKRRHGASDEEIAQEEAEALGPARRDFPLPASAEEGQSAEDEGAVEDAVPETVEDLPTAVEPELMPESEPEPEPESDLRPPTSDQEPEPSREQPRQGNDDDVLEETPEFLQDAPEHDRLWFEQKPPRDFDFE